jgi:triosephosphate isomerase
MAVRIREVVDATRLGGSRDAARNVPILYGGSVTSANFGDFVTEPGIDGGLVGGASLRADEMAAIVARAGVTARARRAAAE